MKQFVASWSQLQEKKKIRVLFKERPVLVFAFGEKAYAIADKCPHMGASLFSGTYQDGVIECKDHGLKIDVATGEVADHKKADFLKMESFERSVRTYRTVIEDGKVFLDA